MNVRHTITGVAGAIALAALAGCAATPSPDSSTVKYGQHVAVPMLEDAGLGTSFKAVDRSFDTVTVAATPDLDELNISVPQDVRQPENSVCTVATFHLPERAELVSGRTSWDDVFALSKPMGATDDGDEMTLRCAARDKNDSPLAVAWDETDEFLAREDAEYTVNVEVPLTEVEALNE